jgi:hypothetical protein
MLFNVGFGLRQVLRSRTEVASRSADESQSSAAPLRALQQEREAEAKRISAQKQSVKLDCDSDEESDEESDDESDDESEE